MNFINNALDNTKANLNAAAKAIGVVGAVTGKSTESKPAPAIPAIPALPVVPTVPAVPAVPAKVETFYPTMTPNYYDYASPVPEGGMGMIPNFDLNKWIRPTYNYPWSYPTYSYPYHLPYQGTYPTNSVNVPGLSCPACEESMFTPKIYGVLFIAFAFAMYVLYRKR